MLDLKRFERSKVVFWWPS